MGFKIELYECAFDSIPIKVYNIFLLITGEGKLEKPVSITQKEKAAQSLCIENGCNYFNIFLEDTNGKKIEISKFKGKVRRRN